MPLSWGKLERQQPVYRMLSDYSITIQKKSRNVVREEVKQSGVLNSCR